MKIDGYVCQTIRNQELVVTLEMLIFYSAQVQKHSPAKYFQMGFYDDYPESPSRMDSILNAIEKRKWKLELEIKDFGMDPILKIHSKNYIEYLESAYEIWAAKGGNENGVLPGLDYDHV